jgi:DNA-binding IclR family transcriptional regulator
MTANQSRKYRIPAVEKMLGIVELLAGESRSYSISELAKRLGMSKNMAFRIVKYLEQQGYLETGNGAGGYQLGKGFYRIGVKLAARYELTDRAHPHLCWLSQQTGETANIQAPAGDRVMVMDVVYPPSDYYFHLSIGTKLLYHCNAMGKCILAYMEREEINKVIPAQLSGQTTKGLRTRAELMKHLEGVRESGLGYDREEYVPGIYCIAAPVFNIHGQAVAGVGITGLVARIDSHNRNEFEGLVREAGRRISSALGFEQK